MTRHRYPGRPRDERRSDRLLRAGLELLGEQGYDLMSMGEVAARAGVSKNTLYRRWSDKLDLVTDACRTFRPAVQWPTPQSGSLREELLAQAEAWRLDVQSGAIVAGMLSAGARDSQVRVPLTALLSGRDRVIGERIKAVAAHLRLELHDRSVNQAVVALQASELRRWTTSGVPMSREQVEQSIEDHLLPLFEPDQRT